jgi:hypothetical protein
MTTARVTCATCGDLEMTTADLTVHTWSFEGRGDFSFRCPICATTTVISAASPTIDLLLAYRTTTEAWDIGYTRPTSRPHETA